MRNIDGLRRGGPGRPAGAANKSTRQVKAFLAQVFDEAFSNPEFKRKLVEQIVTLSIDTKLLGLLLSYYAGRPAVAVDVTRGGVSLAQIITGTVPRDDADDEDDDVGEQGPSRPS